MKNFVFSVFFLCAAISVFAQKTDWPQLDESYRNLSFEGFASKLEREHHIHVFYKTEWVKDLSITDLSETLDPVSTLQLALYDKGYRVVEFQGNLIVMPGSVQSAIPTGRGSSLIVVGNPLDEGKYSTATLSGTVFDGKTRDPIPGAQVLCEALKKVTTTDSKGKFKIELPTGKNKVKFLFIGLETESRDVLIFGDGEIEVDLYEKSIALGQVNVLAERPADNYKSASMGMMKLTAKSMKHLSVMMGEADVIKSMTLIPGVQTTGENASGFNVRGGNIDQNLILVHNTPLFSTTHLFGLFSALDANVVNDVTLYKSGIPARYGGRVSSVMDIDLRKGNTNKFKVDGGIGIINSRLSVEGPIIKDKLSFIAGARTTYSDWMMKLLHDYNLKNSSANFSDFNAKLDYSVNPKNRISLFGYGSNDYFNYYNTAEYGYGNLLGSINWNHTTGKNTSGTLGLHYSRYKASLVDYTTQNFEYDLKTNIAQEQLDYNFTYTPSSEHKINAGLNVNHYGTEPGYSYPHTATSVADSVDMDNESSVEAGLYVEDEIEAISHLAIITGLRYSAFALLGPYTQMTYLDGQTKSGNSVDGEINYSDGEIVKFYHALEPRLAFRYELENSSSVKVGYNRTVQYIRQISNSASITPADYWKSSDPFIKPLIGNQIAAGYFRNLKNDKYEASVEAYYKTTKHAIDYKNGATLILNENLEQVLIDGKGRAFGVEFMLRKPTGRLNGWLSYTYSRSFLKMDGQYSAEKINNGNWYPSNYDKPNDLTVALNYQISRRFTFSSTFTYSTGRPATYPEQKYTISGITVVRYSDRNEYRLPDYHRLDLALTYEGSLLRNQKWRSSWTLALYNAYGRHNPFSVYYAKLSPSEINNYQSYAMYKFSIIGVPVPSFTYNFWF